VIKGPFLFASVHREHHFWQFVQVLCATIRILASEPFHRRFRLVGKASEAISSLGKVALSSLARLKEIQGWCETSCDAAIRLRLSEGFDFPI